MYAEHHDLHHEFPEYKDKIHTLKTSNKHFAKLFDEYHTVDREVRRIEQEIEVSGDTVLENFKKKRLQL